MKYSKLAIVGVGMFVITQQFQEYWRVFMILQSAENAQLMYSNRQDFSGNIIKRIQRV